MKSRGSATLLTRDLTQTYLGYVLGILLTIVVGVLLLRTGEGLARLSYDVPFLFQKQVPEELIMVYLDAMVKKRLQQPTDQPLDRRFHTQLLNRLTKERAKLILYDLLFDQPSADPEVDEEFASAMHAHGRVVLVAESVKQLQANFLFEAPILPTPLLHEAAAGFGIANVDEDKADFSVRRIYPGLENYPSVSWVAASLLEAPVTKPPSDRFEPRWMNYYCPPGKLRAVSLDQVLQTDGLAEGYFRDKLVIIGARQEAGVAGAERETFGNPYSRFDSTRFDSSMSPGPAVHALSLLNLLHGDWLSRLSFTQELFIVVLWGLALAILLMKLAPWYAMGAALLSCVVFVSAAGYLQLRQHIWFAWAVPATAQTSVALIWAVGYRYFIESRRRQRLRQAFAAYASPYMADRIANSRFDLAPGGKEVEATVMFTDLEGFTAMSETLPPAEVSRILIAYFNQTTKAITEQDGMVIKFIGDAVMAAWGAPLPEPKPAERAVLAAWNMSEGAREEIEGRRLRTRIGINSGTVLAGNLGSDLRFDYTLIGDAINVASRLESLNKRLGTNILISESTHALLSDRVQIRKLGQFAVAGRSNAIGVREVLGIGEPAGPTPPWVETFSRALETFVQGDFAAAEKLFREVIRMRDGKDGPSEFFLEHIQAMGWAAPSAGTWNGVVRLEEK